MVDGMYHYEIFLISHLSRIQCNDKQAGGDWSNLVKGAGPRTIRSFKLPPKIEHEASSGCLATYKFYGKQQQLLVSICRAKISRGDMTSSKFLLKIRNGW